LFSSLVKFLLIGIELKPHWKERIGRQIKTMYQRIFERVILDEMDFILCIS
jgi:hypothetical protein